MKAPVILVAALVITLVIFTVTLPVFALVRGTEAEIPIALLILSLGIVGILSAQIALYRKGKGKQGQSFTIASLIQSLLLTSLSILIFIYTTQYYWYPSVVMALSVVLVILFSYIIARNRRARRG